MKKSFFKSLFLAILFIIIGAGLILYSYLWNSYAYHLSLEDSFTYNDDIIEIGHGFKFGYYDPALYGTPICIALAVASFWVPAKLRARKARALAEEQAKQRAFEEKHPHYEAEQFYKGARDAGLSEVETSAGRARLMLYAKNKGLQLTETQAVEQFLLGQSEVERLKEQKKQAKKQIG